MPVTTSLGVLVLPAMPMSTWLINNVNLVPALVKPVPILVDVPPVKITNILIPIGYARHVPPNMVVTVVPVTIISVLPVLPMPPTSYLTVIALLAPMGNGPMEISAEIVSQVVEYVLMPPPVLPVTMENIRMGAISVKIVYPLV